MQTLEKCTGTLFFRADDGTSGPELWKSDGTAAGTTLVKDLSPLSSSFLDFLTNVNGTLFLLARDANQAGDGLWKSDGTEAVLGGRASSLRGPHSLARVMQLRTRRAPSRASPTTTQRPRDRIRVSTSGSGRQPEDLT